MRRGYRMSDGLRIFVVLIVLEGTVAIASVLWALVRLFS